MPAVGTECRRAEPLKAGNASPGSCQTQRLAFFVASIGNWYPFAAHELAEKPLTILSPPCPRPVEGGILRESHAVAATSE